MTAVIVSLGVIIMLLLVTGWPGRQKEELEQLASSPRREMAEYYDATICQLNSIRITIEDSVCESVEREMATTRPRSRSRKARAKSTEVVAPESAEVVQESSVDETPQSVLDARQISLFEAVSPKLEAVVSKPEEPVSTAASSMPVIGGDDLRLLR